MEKYFAFPNFITPVSRTSREVLDKDTTIRDKTYLDGLWVTKGESVSVSMMLNTVLELDQHYNVFNYGPPRPQKYLNPQDIKILAGPGMKPAPNIVFPGHSKEKIGK